MSESKLSVRVNPENPNHHLWDNNGTFWCHFTVHLAGFRKERRRVSLGTHDAGEARKVRDSLLASLGLENLAAVETGRASC